MTHFVCTRHQGRGRVLSPTTHLFQMQMPVQPVILFANEEQLSTTLVRRVVLIHDNLLTWKDMTDVKGRMKRKNESTWVIRTKRVVADGQIFTYKMPQCFGGFLSHPQNSSSLPALPHFRCCTNQSDPYASLGATRKLRKESLRRKIQTFWTMLERKLMGQHTWLIGIKK